MTTTAVTARGLGVRQGDTRVLQGLDVTFAAGRWTSVVGPNGAGKSTLLQALAGLLPSDGEVTLLGDTLHSLPGRLRAQRLAWLGQGEFSGEGGAQTMRAHDVALLGRLPHRDWLAAPDATDLAAVELAMRSTQTWELRLRPLGQLSAGERQRVLLARVLAVGAPIPLMDEPLTNLDPPHQADWLAVVRSLLRQGCTVVSVLHEISMALRADDMVVMSQGRITHTGACALAETHRAVEAVFDQRLSIHALHGHWIACPMDSP